MAIALVGHLGFKAWLESRKQIKGLEVDIVRSQQETKRMEIMASVASTQPVVLNAINSSTETNNRLLKALKPDDKITFKGEHLTGAVAAEVTQPERAASEDIQIDGTFRVLGNRTDKTSGFRITLQRTTDDLVVTADVPDELNVMQKAAIKEAEWGKWLLDVTMNASTLRGTLHSAVVISAKKYVPPN
ncbi:MAG: hypothetical protein ACT4PZ_14345 [Panacagrimonas sp.]